jgi:hypothetical protein
MKSTISAARYTPIFLAASLAVAYAVSAGWGAMMSESTPLPGWLANRPIAVGFHVVAAIVAAIAIMLPRRHLGPAARCTVVLALLVSLIVVPRLYTFFEAFERDLMVYMTAASRILDGESLYAQVWDHKPPAVHWTYAAAAGLLGPTPAAIAFLGIAAALVTLAGCFRAGALIGGRTGGLAAGLIWTLASGDLILQANQPNVEVFINACLVWAFALLPTRPAEGHSLGRRIAIGALFFLASLYKPIVLPAAALLLGLQGMFCLRADSNRLNLLWVNVLVPGGVILLGWTLVVAGFVMSGRLPDFIEAVFTYNQAYAGSLSTNLALGFKALLLPAFLPYFLMALAAGVILWLRRRSLRPILLLGTVAYLVGAWMALALPGNFFEHYYQLLLPPIAVVAGGAIGLVRRRQMLVALMWASVAPLLFVRALQADLDLDAIPIAKYGRHGVESIESRQMAPWLNAQLGRDQRLFHWGAEPGVYFWARRPVPTKFSYAYPLASPAAQNTGLAAKFTDETLRQLNAMPPDLIVANRDWIERLDHPVKDWIRRNYEPIQGPPDMRTFLFYRPIARRSAP